MRFRGRFYLPGKQRLHICDGEQRQREREREREREIERYSRKREIERERERMKQRKRKREKKRGIEKERWTYCALGDSEGTNKGPVSTHVLMNKGPLSTHVLMMC